LAQSTKEKARMSLFVRYVMLIIFCIPVWASLVLARDAILPQGHPRLQESDTSEQDRREEIRRNRLKQQGQGDNYRIEGERQGGTDRSIPDPSPGLGRQDTGLADPSVNPGQAEGLRSIRGEIVHSEDDIHTVREKSGVDTILMVDDYTRGDTQLRPGDQITGTLTEQGRAVIVKKVPPPDR
jgi:hypothetical protein